MYGASEHTRQLMDRYRNLRFAVERAASDAADAGDPAGTAVGGVAENPSWGQGSVTAVTNDRCGDSVQLLVWMTDDGKRVARLLHHSVGCSICRVSADFLCEAAVGLTLSELSVLAGEVRDWQTGTADRQDAAGNAAPANAAADNAAPPIPQLGLFVELRGTRSRARCLLLAWEAAEQLCHELESKRG